MRDQMQAMIFALIIPISVIYAIGWGIIAYKVYVLCFLVGLLIGRVTK